MIHGDLSIALLFTIYQLNGSFSNPLIDTVRCLNDLKTTDSIMDSFQSKNMEILDNSAGDNEIKNNVVHHDFHSFELLDSVIQIDDIVLIDGFNLKVFDNEKVLLRAPSGYGKSTLFDYLLGKRILEKGKYFFNNHEITQGHDCLEYFALISQNPFMFDDSIYFNITLGEKYTSSQFEHAIEVACLIDFVSEKGVDYVVGENGENLSGGQIQRIEIARAIIKNRPIILADEPTSSLDQDLAYRVQTNLINNTRCLIEVAHHISIEEVSMFNRVINLRRSKKTWHVYVRCTVLDVLRYYRIATCNKTNYN